MVVELNTDTSSTNSYWDGVCPYANECSDYPYKCYSCKHSKKKSHYEPDWSPWYPNPWYPYVTYGDHTTCTTSITWS